MDSSGSLLSRQGLRVRCGGCGCGIPRPPSGCGTIDATCGPCRLEIEGDADLEALLTASMARGMTLREAAIAAGYVPR